MAKGFKAVVVDLIREDPGKTAFEYARMALTRGLWHSDATRVPPEFSGGTTLLKEYREGRMPEIIAKKAGGQTQFYPRDHEFEGGSDGSMTVQVQIPREVAEDLRRLIEVRDKTTPNDEVVWLLTVGWNAEKEHIKKLYDAWQEMRRSSPTRPGSTNSGS